MHFGLSEDDVALREGLRELLADACSSATIRAAWAGSACEQLWTELGSFGLLGLLVDEQRGGLGLDHLAFVAAMEQAGWHGVPGPLVETVTYLPDSGLPLDGSARIAVQRPGAVHVPYAAVATHVFREDDLTLLSSFRADPATSVDLSRRLAVVQGQDPPDRSGSPVVSVVSAEQHEAAGGKPPRPPASLAATLGTAAFLLGLARRQIDLTVSYVKDRTQFGVPIGSFQAVKHPLADAVVGTEFAWPAVLRAAHSLATADPQAPLHVSMAKALASDASYRVSRVCLQAHGAMGYTVEYDLHLFAKRTWAMAKDWGSADEHREMIARELL